MWGFEAYSEQAYNDEDFRTATQNKAIYGSLREHRTYNNPSFWVMGSNLRAAYKRLAKHYIFVAFGYGNYWREMEGEQNGK